MNVVYDLLGFQSRDHGERGIARYVLHLGLALERVRPGLVTQYLMHPHLPFPAGAEPLLATGRVVRADEPSPQREPRAGGVFIAGSPFETFNYTSELVLPAFARSPYWRSAAVVHDVIPAIFPELYLADRVNVDYYHARLHALFGFDRFLTNSQATTDDAVKMLDLDPAHFTLAGAGADAQFGPPEHGHEAAAEALVADGALPGLRPGYVLFPTGIDPRKNVERTIQAYGRLPRQLREQHQLVLSCRLSDPDREHVERVARGAGVTIGQADGTGEMLVTGYVSDDTLCRLYQGAHLVVFPSYYEGFGLPALEAMTCGAPVICADATSLKEVQPLPEARFDPMSVTAIADAVAKALADDDFRQRLRQQDLPPFTWDLAAERTAGVIDELAGLVEERLNRRRARPKKPRLAVFGPLPPQLTDTAEYMFRLLDPLRDLCDVTVFVDDNPLHVWAPDGVTIESVDDFDHINASGRAFDKTLVMLGNDGLHLPYLRALERRPGPVLFLSARLTAVYGERQETEPHLLEDQTVGGELAAMYPGRYRPEVEAMTQIEPETASRFGVLMALDAARRATDVLVHAEFTGSMLAIDSGVDPQVLAPFPCPPIIERLKAPPHRPVVAAFGAVDGSRVAERLIAAWASAADRPADALLQFVGQVDYGRRLELEALAEACGVGASVELTGVLTGGDLALTLDNAALAVQLAPNTDGSCSARLAELFANGVPTVVAAVGPTTELPDDVAIKVDPAVGTDELGAIITGLLADGDRRAMLATAATDYAKTHSYAAVARRLADVLFGSANAI